MKKTASIIASVLLIAVLISALAVNVFAETAHTTFSLSLYTGSYSHIQSVQEKDDSSDMMIGINSPAPNSVYNVRAIGCRRDGSEMVNCTLYGSQMVDHVMVLPGYLYRVDNAVEQRGIYYATFGVMSSGNPGTITGWWAADIATDDNIEYRQAATTT